MAYLNSEHHGFPHGEARGRPQGGGARNHEGLYPHDGGTLPCEDHDRHDHPGVVHYEGIENDGDSHPYLLDMPVKSK